MLAQLRKSPLFCSLFPNCRIFPDPDNGWLIPHQPRACP